jgi:DNA polymerase-3 subunit delta'
MPFSDVVGHVRLLDLLSRSIAGGTLPPSLLLTGPDGIGKKLTAIAVAQALNCLAPRMRTLEPRTANRTLNPEPGTLNPSGADACGTCPACVRIARRVHPDVLVVEPGESGAIKIDQVRDIVDRAAYRPFEGRRRAVIVDDADTLVPQAQHALLKTLEEPPPSSVFLLVTARPDVLLPTVRSRCPQLRFRPLQASDIATVLVARGQTEREARAVAATADGSLGRALEASSEDLVEARDRAERVLAQAAASADPGRRLASVTELLTKTGAGGAGDRDHLATHLRAMAALVRDVELLATRADARALANPDVQPALERLAPAYGGDRGVRAFIAIDRALDALDGNASAKVVADWLVLQL